MPEDTLHSILFNLNNSLEYGSDADLHRWVNDFNHQMQYMEMFGVKHPKSGGDHGHGAMGFIKDVVRNKGVRFPSLEKALHVDKVTLTGNVHVKQNFFEAIKGNEPPHMSLDRGEIRLEIRF